MAALFGTQVHDASLANSLFDVYVQYKKDTRAIVSWLLSHQPMRKTSPENLSVRDLLAIAEYACAKAVAMPDIIAFHFQHAIRARAYLTKVFRKASKENLDSKATENHEFFTSSLTKIYADLCKCCAKPKDACHHRSCEDDCTTSTGTCFNPYIVLASDGHEHEHSTLSGAAPALDALTTGKLMHSNPVPSASPFTLADDGLSNAFEIYQHVHEIHETFSKVHAIWQKAAQGRSHVIAAAATTNVVYALLEDIEHRLSSSCNIIDPADLFECYEKLRDLNQTCVSKSVAKSLADETIRDLNCCWQAMLDLRSAATKDDFTEAILKTQLPHQIRLRQGPDASSPDAQCRSVLLSNIAQCITGSRLSNTFIRSGSPVVPEVGYFMSHDKSPSNCLHCASGISLLMTSYKAYSFSLQPGQSPSSCRVQVLRFAQAAVTQISAVLDDPTMPCRCHNTLAFHLENLKHHFEEFLRTKMFDFYFQSPWVCGGHVLEMLHALHYYGLRLVAYKSYVGSVVHMYNVLRQLHDCPHIPVLEAMCVHLENLFFPGGRPRRSFGNCFVRYLGGRLRFHGQAAQHQNGCHGLAIPVHAAKATAGFSSGGVAERKDARFDCGRFSLLYWVKERDYRVGGHAIRNAIARRSTPQTEGDDPYSLFPKRFNTLCERRKARNNNEQRSASFPCVPPTPTTNAEQRDLQPLHQALANELHSTFSIPKIQLSWPFTSFAHVSSTGLATSIVVLIRWRKRDSTVFAARRTLSLLRMDAEKGRAGGGVVGRRLRFARGLFVKSLRGWMWRV